MRMALASVFALVTSGLAAPGGAIEWASDWSVALDRAHLEDRPVLLYFTVPSCPVDQALDAGAFSAAGIVDAATGFVCVRLPWDDSEQQRGLRKALGVTGAPTVVLLDPSGGFIEVLASTEPEEVEAQLERVAATIPHAAALRGLPDARGTPWDWIRARIADLGNDDFEVRDHATQELARLQASLRTAIEEAKRSEDAEVRARAEEVDKAETAPSCASSDQFTVDVVVELLQKRVKTYWIIRRIATKGMKFSLTAEDMKRLLEAGADLELIDAMRPRSIEDR